MGHGLVPEGLGGPALSQGSEFTRRPSAGSAAYLFLGLVAMMLVLQTFRYVSDLHGFTELVLLPSPCPASPGEDDDDRVDIVDPQPESQQQLAAGSHADYASIPR